MTTHYHSQYWANALTVKTASDSIHNLSRSIANARVDLNPHPAAAALTEKLAGQKKLKAVESERNKKRRELYDAQDAIDGQRDELIAKIEGQLKMQERSEQIFIIRWTIT